MFLFERKSLPLWTLFVVLLLAGLALETQAQGGKGDNGFWKEKTTERGRKGCPSYTVTLNKKGRHVIFGGPTIARRPTAARTRTGSRLANTDKFEAWAAFRRRLREESAFWKNSWTLVKWSGSKQVRFAVTSARYMGLSTLQKTIIGAIKGDSDEIQDVGIAGFNMTKVLEYSLKAFTDHRDERLDQYLEDLAAKFADDMKYQKETTYSLIKEWVFDYAHGNESFTKNDDLVAMALQELRTRWQNHSASGNITTRDTTFVVALKDIIVHTNKINQPEAKYDYLEVARQNVDDQLAEGERAIWMISLLAKVVKAARFDDKTATEMKRDFTIATRSFVNYEESLDVNKIQDGTFLKELEKDPSPYRNVADNMLPSVDFADPDQARISWTTCQTT